MLGYQNSAGNKILQARCAIREMLKMIKLHILFSLSSFIVPHGTTCYGTPPWLLWAGCPRCVPSKLMGHSHHPLWQGSVRS